MTGTYLDDNGASISALDHQLRVELDPGRLRTQFGDVADRDGVQSVDVLAACRPRCFINESQTQQVVIFSVGH